MWQDQQLVLIFQKQLRKFHGEASAGLNLRYHQYFFSLQQIDKDSSKITPIETAWLFAARAIDSTDFYFALGIWLQEKK